MASDVIIHPSAVCEAHALGRGTQVGPLASVQAGATLGDDVLVGAGAHFSNEHPGRAGWKKPPRALLHTTVGRGASLGTASIIEGGLTLGPFCVVGDGSRVTTSVPAHACVEGAPAARVGWACECGARLPEELRCVCGRTYAHAGDDGGLARCHAA
jgi:acetyltransferase-like isoleucine patch superfamily enzyme